MANHQTGMVSSGGSGGFQKETKVDSQLHMSTGFF